ncbi:MAG: 2-hydroxyacyl-CoA dehydratase [Chloroflexota bacterium]|nr:MAG: 2-hydroxyacyl-CoA dehydratase [Chloroflexota bacterium]
MVQKTAENRGLTRAAEIYQDRGQRVRELKAAGKTIIGYHCCYVPVELLTAAGVVPFRIVGDTTTPTSVADSVLENEMCAWVRNCFEGLITGRLGFLDGMVVPHACNSVERIYGYWKQYGNLKYAQSLDVPHVFQRGTFQFFRQEIQDFKTSLERLTGSTISPEAVAAAIELHNRNRALVQHLYALRKESPPLVSGTEVLQTLVAGLSLPVEEFNHLLEEVIQEAEQRRGQIRGNPVRLLLHGCVVDNLPLLELLESFDSRIVIDDQPIGTRTFWFQVRTDGDPLLALSEAYLKAVRCPRTMMVERKNFEEGLKQRFEYLVDYAREFNVQGVVLHILRFCDPHQFDNPDLTNYLKAQGLSSVTLDEDYTVGNIGRLKTRVEAFIETLTL